MVPRLAGFSMPAQEVTAVIKRNGCAQPCIADFMLCAQAQHAEFQVCCPQPYALHALFIYRDLRLQKLRLFVHLGMQHRPVESQPLTPAAACFRSTRAA